MGFVAQNESMGLLQGNVEEKGKQRCENRQKAYPRGNLPVLERGEQKESAENEQDHSPNKPTNHQNRVHLEWLEIPGNHLNCTKEYQHSKHHESNAPS